MSQANPDLVDVDVDPLALVALADAADETAALPSPYTGDVAQEDDSDTHDVNRTTDSDTSTPEEA